jgi:hypothetical protein
MLSRLPRDAPHLFFAVLSGERVRFADCSYKRAAALDVLSSKEVKQECQEVFPGKEDT